MAKGYIYISGGGADPGQYGNLNDPLFGPSPSLGACMPNIRRWVVPGDHIFVVSGKTTGVQQYVVGGMRVAEKIDALSAFGRFPENRLLIDGNGVRQGNIIVTPTGRQHPDDDHSADTFEQRIRNYVVGSDPVSLETQSEVERGRAQTLNKLSEILGKPQANRAIDIMGRCTKLDDVQVSAMRSWLLSIKD